MLPICCAAAGLLAAVLPGRAALSQWYQDAGLPAADTDGDGIPDAWESRTFGDPAAADSGLDRDGDGLTGLEEFVFGSDPRTPGTMGDGWSDREKRDAGLDAGFRVTPAVTFAQWLEWLEWDAEDWLTQTATNAEGFAVSYGGFVCNNAPYSDTNLNATVDFWLVTRTDRPAWLTVGDALTTNCFPVRAGVGRARVRAAYGGPVSLTLDPLPGTLAELPGAAIAHIGLGALYGLVVGFIGFGLIFYGMKRLTLFQYGALSYTEVPFAVLAGILFLGEGLTINQMAGILLVVGGSFLAQRLRSLPATGAPERG